MRRLHRLMPAWPQALSGNSNPPLQQTRTQSVPGRISTRSVGTMLEKGYFVRIPQIGVAMTTRGIVRPIVGGERRQPLAEQQNGWR